MVKGPTPSTKKTVIKKRTKSFLRFQADQFLRLSHRDKNSWRKPKGIDNRARRRYKGNIRLVKIGYGSNAKTRHIMPNGFLKFVISNVKDLEMLLMQNRKYAAEVAHNVGARTRTLIEKRAKELNIKLTNPGAKLQSVAAE
jgi:large subunit ribosomal protein L32e